MISKTWERNHHFKLPSSSVRLFKRSTIYRYEMRAVLFAAVILSVPAITMGLDRNTDAPEACGAHGVCACTKGRSGIDVDCNELNLTVIPRDLPGNSTIVKLARNFLEEVPSSSFRGLPKMFKLFLGYNNISELPGDVFASCPELEILKISNNNIRQLPDQLLTFSRKWLIIDLSNNQLTSLPEMFFQNQPVLSHALLSYNQLQKIPSKLFFELPRLKTIDLSNNKLQTLPRDMIWSAPNLRQLYLSKNQLVEIAGDMFSRKSLLQEINFSFNNLTSLPKDLFASTPHAKIINLNNNSLSTLPVSLFSHASSLQDLKLAGNKLQSVPEGFFSNTSGLLSIDLRGNLLQTLPQTLFSPQSRIRFVKVSENCLQEVPENLFNSSPNLYLVDFSTNNLTTLPGNLFKQSAKVQSIKAAYNQLDDIPQELFEGTADLRELSLKNNSLKTLSPLLLRNTTHLTQIYLSFNQFEEFPEDIFQNLPNLYKVDLSFNLLQEVPEMLFNSTYGIKNINLSNNKFKWIPPRLLAATSQLLFLSLSKNYVNELPEFLLNSAPTLEVLDLSFNQINKIPPRFLASARELTTLKLGHNNLTEIPPELFQVARKVQTVFLNLNHIKEMPERLFAYTPKLAFLKLTNNSLRFLPDDFLANCSELKMLYLSNNSLQKLPSSIFLNKPLLTNVDLFNSKLEEIPRNTFQSTPSLSFLQMHGNNIKEIPDYIFNATPQLNYLDFSANKVKNITKKTFHGMTNVTALSVSRNTIETLPQDIFSEIMLSDKLDISSNELKTIPGGLFTSSNVTHPLTILFLHKNMIEFIPKMAFAGLYHIKYLLLYSNNIHTIFDDAFVDTSVSAIYLFGNKLTEIGGNPFNNDNISEVHLYGNQIKTIAESTLLGLRPDVTVYLRCGDLTEAPWSPNHVSIKCVSPAYVPTLSLPRSLLPEALRQEGFNCSLGRKGDSKCEPCRPGTFGDGIFECHKCPPGGFYQNDIGQAAPLPGGMACKYCNIGTFVPDGGGTTIGQCKVCPEGTNQTTMAGFRACTCKENYTRTHRFGPCELCLEPGLNCTSQEFKSLLPGYYWNWTFPEANITEYVQFAKNLEDESRFYKMVHVNYSREIPKVYKCQKPSSCRNNNTLMMPRIAGTCADGYRGWMCGKCKTGYYSVLNSCIPCPANVWLFVEPIGLVGLGLVFYLLVLWQYKRQKKNKNERSIMDVIISRTKIVLGFYQVIGEFFASLHDVNWAGALQVIGEAISYMELTILRVIVHPQCYSSNLEINPKLEFIIGTSLPVVIVTVAVIYYLTSKCCIFRKRRSPTNHFSRESHLFKIKMKLYTVVLVLLFITYPPICSAVFQLYPRACQSFCLDHNSRYCITRLRSDFDIDCEELHTYHYMAYIATAFYIIMFPLTLLILLRRHCSNKAKSCNDSNVSRGVNEESTTDEQTPLLHNEPEAPAIPVWLNFLCENYKPQFWYWEIVELSRKVTQTVLITLLGWEDKLTVLFTIGTSVLFLTMHARFWPMKDLFDQRLQMFSLTAIFINVVVAAMQVPEYYEGTINIILVLLNVVVILILAAAAFLSFIRHVRKIQLMQDWFRILERMWSRVSFSLEGQTANSANSTTDSSVS